MQQLVRPTDRFLSKSGAFAPPRAYLRVVHSFCGCSRDLFEVNHGLARTILDNFMSGASAVASGVVDGATQVVDGTTPSSPSFRFV